MPLIMEVIIFLLFQWHLLQAECSHIRVQPRTERFMKSRTSPLYGCESFCTCKHAKMREKITLRRIWTKKKSFFCFSMHGSLNFTNIFGMCAHKLLKIVSVIKHQWMWHPPRPFLREGIAGQITDGKLLLPLHVSLWIPWSQLGPVADNPQFQPNQIPLIEIQPWHLAFKSATTYRKTSRPLAVTLPARRLHLRARRGRQGPISNLKIECGESSGCNSYCPTSGTSTSKSAGSGRCYMNINNSCWWSVRKGGGGPRRGGEVVGKRCGRRRG